MAGFSQKSTPSFLETLKKYFYLYICRKVSCYNQILYFIFGFFPTVKQLKNKFKNNRENGGMCSDCV